MPAALSINTSTRGARFTPIPGGQSITHSEMTKVVLTAGGGFSLTPYVINPGNSALFPWLSGLAPSFEYWRVRKLVARYVPTCPVTVAGTIALQVDYDVMDDPPSDMSQAMQSMGAVSGPPYTINPLRLVFDIPSIHARQPRLYTTDRKNPQSVSSPFDYFGGHFNLITSGNSDGGTVCGQLWFDYTFDLLTPQPREAGTLLAYTQGQFTSYGNASAVDYKGDITSIFQNLVPTVDQLKIGPTDALGYARLVQDGMYSLYTEAVVGPWNSTGTTGQWYQTNIKSYTPTGDLDLAYSRALSTNGTTTPMPTYPYAEIIASAGARVISYIATTSGAVLPLALQAGGLFVLTYLGKPKELLTPEMYAAWQTLPQDRCYVILNGEFHDNITPP